MEQVEQVVTNDVKSLVSFVKGCPKPMTMMQIVDSWMAQK